MRTHLRHTCVAVAVLCAIGSAAEAPRVTVAVGSDRIDVTIDDKLFTALHTAKAPQKLYLHPLLTPSGKRVTRAFPMETVAGESTDHPHQRGVWIGAEHVNDEDFWENEPADKNPRAGTVVLTDVIDVRSGTPTGQFTMRANWIARSGQTLVAETRTMTFRAPAADQRSIDIDLELQAKQQVTFADNHDALLGLRLSTEFEEAHGGKAVNAEGVTGWERLHATIDGEDVGVAVMDAPTNFRFPTPWHVRDYALLFASPFAFRDYKPTAQDGSLTLKPGEDLKLRYRILVHSGAVDVKSAFDSFARPAQTERAGDR
jgi:hypothetical protein